MSLENSGSFDLSSAYSKKSSRQIINEIDDEGKISDGSFFPLGEEFEPFDKVIISIKLGSNSASIFEAIENSDFYLLVARAGEVNLKTLEKFGGDMQKNKNKCLGFLLIK